MAQRFKSSGTAQAIALAGTTIPHGLGVTPDEVWFTPILGTSALIYQFSAADATNIYLAAGSAAASATGYAASNHSIVK